MYSTVADIGEALGFDGAPTDAQELAAVTSVRAAATAVVNNETGSRFAETELDDIPQNIHLATVLLAIDFYRARSATRGGGLADSESDFPSPTVMMDVRRILAPYRRIRLFGGATQAGSTSTVSSGVTEVADGSITLLKLSTVVRGLLESPVPPDGVISLSKLNANVRSLVETGGITDGSITIEKLANALADLIRNPTPPDNSVTYDKLADDVETQVRTPTLANHSVVLNNLEQSVQNKINSPVPADGSITNEKLDSGLQTSIQTPLTNIGDGTIPLTKLVTAVQNKINTPVNAGDIGTNEIADGAITNIKLGDDAVNTEELHPLAVDNTILANDAVRTAKIANLQVTTDKIANDQITAEKIANDAITTDKIGNSQVTLGKMANDSVDTDQLLEDAVTLVKMADDSVTAHQIVDGSLIPATYGTSTIPNVAIENGVITESKFHADVQTKLNSTVIGEGAVDTTQIALGAVSRTRIDPNFLADLPPGGQGVSPVNRRIFLGSSDLRIPGTGTIDYGHLAGFRRVDGNRAEQADGALLTGERTYVIRWLQSGTQYTNNGNHLPHGTILDNRGVINLANGSWYVDVNLVIIPDPNSPSGNNDRMMAAAILFYGSEELHSSSHYFPNHYFNGTDYRSTQSRINVSGFVHDDGSSRMSVGFRVIIQGGSNLEGYRVPRANFHAVRIM